MNKISFIGDVNSYNISDMICNIEEELREINNHDWDFSFGGDDSITETIKRILSEADFNNIDLLHDFGCYWCTCLTSEPFEGTRWADEESFLNNVKDYHLAIRQDIEKGLILYFKNNSKSPLYKFFLKHRDGYGGNIAYSINAGLNKLWKYIKKDLRKNADNYGTWYEGGYCENCSCMFYEESGKCPECGGELTYNS
jgi:hypothetical protein